MNLNPLTEKAKIRADEYRLQHIRRDLEAIVKTTPCPSLRKIASNAKKEIRI